MKLIYLILAALVGGVMVYLVLTVRKNWRHLPKSMKVLDVAVILLDVAVCALNLARALL